MSSSYSCEQRLRSIAERLRAEAADLENAADVLELLRKDEGREDRIKEAKQWAKEWMKK